MADGRTANRTRQTAQPVDEFVESVDPPRRREEARRVVALLTDATGVDPVMWGGSIIGWGAYTYRYASGREGEWMKVGFSPRKAQLSFYGLQDSAEQRTVLDSLGPHTRGVGCVYVRRLELVDDTVLIELAQLGIARADHITT